MTAAPGIVRLAGTREEGDLLVAVVDLHNRARIDEVFGADETAKAALAQVRQTGAPLAVITAVQRAAYFAAPSIADAAEFAAGAIILITRFSPRPVALWVVVDPADARDALLADIEARALALASGNARVALQ